LRRILHGSADRGGVIDRLGRRKVPRGTTGLLVLFVYRRILLVLLLIVIWHRCLILVLLLGLLLLDILLFGDRRKFQLGLLFDI
jgi:hypothetical protein